MIATTSQSAGHGGDPVAPIFARVLCGIDGSRGGFEAARQAAVLAGRDAEADAALDRVGPGHGPRGDV